MSIVGASTRLDDGTLRLGPEAGQVLTAAALATLTGGGNADALHTHAGQVRGEPRYVGVTNATFTGDLGGPIGANAKCSAEFPGTFMCHYCTVFRARLTQPLPREAWLEWGFSCAGSAPVSEERAAAYNCTQWTESAGTGASVGIQGRLNYLPGGMLQPCASEFAIACCAD